MARPVIALLTDFGVSDHYVAAMKGVVLQLCPDVTLLDITHDIPPQDILGGALELQAVAPYLPDRTIVLGVVDPGVGSERRGIVIETQAGLQCVGPDNGLFSLVADAASTVHSITNRALTRAFISRTFEGRDRFAPVAARLACGTTIAEVGPAVSDMRRLELPRPAPCADGVDGEVLRIDRFGNLVTNLEAAVIEPLGQNLLIQLPGDRIAPLVGTYAESPAGVVCALMGSAGRLEIAVPGGSAAAALALARGARVRVRRRLGA